MKKGLNYLTKLSLGLAFVALVSACSKQAPTAANSETASNSIVYVNSDSLLSNYEYFKSIRGRFEEKSKKAQADLNAKGTAFQREVAQYQQQAGSMSADQRAATEERLARKQQELAAYNQNASNALANEEAAENEKLYEKVSEFLKKFAKEKGYKMVLTYSKGNSAVLFADESLDVTKEVVAGLNEAYKKGDK
jgi:outer membrane protein